MENGDGTKKQGALESVVAQKQCLETIKGPGGFQAGLCCRRRVEAAFSEIRPGS